MSETDVTILADMRESRSGILERLKAMGAKVQVVELETGDYVLSADIAVERKTAQGFIKGDVYGTR